MTVARIIAALVGIALAALLLATVADTASLENFRYELEALTDQRWALFALLDRFAGFIILAILIALTERSAIAAVLWALPIFVFGNIWAALWLVIRLPALAERLRAAARPRARDEG